MVNLDSRVTCKHGNMLASFGTSFLLWDAVGLLLLRCHQFSFNFLVDI